MGYVDLIVCAYYTVGLLLVIGGLSALVVGVVLGVRV